MFARKTKLNLPDGSFIETPILLPAFSSRGFPDIKDIVKGVREVMVGPALISAYDIHYNYKRIGNFSFLKPLIFIDSGGYECLSNNGIIEHSKNRFKLYKWSTKLYNQAIRKFLNRNRIPKAIVSYDRTMKLSSQIKLANSSFKSFVKEGQEFLKEILLKPESKKQRYLNMNEVIANIRKLGDFDIIGMTEKELGNCLLDRMENLSKIREALTDNNMNQLLHVFGSLDTIVTPLYFFCGADIFDGLTWLRYSYLKGLTIYQPNNWIEKFSVDIDDYYLRLTTFIGNYHYIKEMELQMKSFVKNKNFSVFNSKDDFIDRGELFRKVLEKMK